MSSLAIRFFYAVMDCMVNNFETAYHEALALAETQLLNSTIPELCRFSGARLVACETNTALELLYLNHPVRIVFSAPIEFSTQDHTPVHVWDKILLLHYLVQSKPGLKQSRQIGFKELKSAALYYSLFEARCLKPLLKAFGNRPQELIERAESLRGEMIEAGDAAVRLQVFPEISISIVLWAADDEFPASANILFEPSIEQYLSAEDNVVLCQRVALKLTGKW